MSCVSMTGFGQARFDGVNYRVLFELRTVNHRFCEWNLRLPRDLMSLEAEIRAYLATRVSRGRGDLFITIDSTDSKSSRVHVDWSVVDGLNEAYRIAAERYGCPMQHDEAILRWLTFPEAIHVERAAVEVEKARTDVMAGLRVAVDSLVEARRREGERIGLDMMQKRTELQALVAGIREMAPKVATAHAERLRQRMAEFSGTVDEGRLLTELAVLMDRMTIDEELVRMDSHLDEFGVALKTDGPVGRRLDFIVQELHREINTIGSKANHLGIATSVVDAKVVIEQLREQAQNIE